MIHPVPNNNIAAHPDPDNGIAASLPETREESVHGASEYKLDNIRTVYHPSSGRPTQIAHFEDYHLSSAFQHIEPPINPHPWRPFASRHDFELAELVLDAALNERQMKTMFRLLNPEAESSPSAEFNIHSPKEFKEHWDCAANLITPVCPYGLAVSFINYLIFFHFSSRSQRLPYNSEVRTIPMMFTGGICGYGHWN